MGWFSAVPSRSAKVSAWTCWPRCPAGCSHRRPALFVVRLAAVALFVLVVCAGLLGTQSLLKNIAPAFVWALWWVGMTYISALVGDLWALLNPLDTLFAGPRRRMRACAGPAPVARSAVPAGGRHVARRGAVSALRVDGLVWEGADRPASLSLAIWPMPLWRGPACCFSAGANGCVAARCSRSCSACSPASRRRRYARSTGAGSEAAAVQGCSHASRQGLRKLR